MESLRIPNLPVCVAMRAAFLAAIVLPGCAGSPLPQKPEVKVISSAFNTHPIGGPNYLLHCELVLRFQTGGEKLEIVETVGEKKPELRFSFDGWGVSSVPIQLEGTFVNDGETSRMEALKAELPAKFHWPASLSPGETATFLEYEGLDGTPVRYEVRLAAEVEPN